MRKKTKKYIFSVGVQTDRPHADDPQGQVNNFGHIGLEIKRPSDGLKGASQNQR